MGGKTETLKGLLCLVGAALTVASFGVFVHLASPMFGTGMQSLLRALIAAALLAGAIAWRRNLPKLTRAQYLRVGLVGLGAFGTFALFTVSVHVTKVGIAMGVLYGCSIITACVSGALFLKESFTKMQLAGTLLALVGLSLYAGNVHAIGLGAGIIAAAAAGVCDGVANCVRKTLRGIDRNTVVMYQSIVTVAGALCIVFSTGEHYLAHASWVAALAMAALGVLSLALGSMLLYGFAHFEVHVGAVVLSSQVFFAVLFGMLFLHESPTLYELAGCSLVCMGGALTTLRSDNVLFAKALTWLHKRKVVYEDA
jgi:drug/metabolite transporter (DMT)-like permease